MTGISATTRRHALIGMAGLSLGGIAASGQAAARVAAPPPIPDVAAYLALRFAGPQRVGWWINRATVFALVLGRRTIPLFDVIGLGRDSYVAMPDGSFHLNFDECGWYCAPGTTVPLTSMVSPINGRTITVQHYRSPNDTMLTNGKQVMTKPIPPGVEIETVRSALQSDGEQVWMSDDHIVRSPRKVSEEALRANPAAAWNVQTSLATYNARRDDLMAYRRRWVPATCAYQTLASWRTWFDADETPGVMSWRMHGTKVASIKDMPDPLLGLVRAQHPALLES